MVILACDVGDTKTDIALLEPSETGLRITRRETYQSGQHASLDEIVTSFVGPTPPRLEAAGFGAWACRSNPAHPECAGLASSQ